jgi:integrase
MHWTLQSKTSSMPQSEINGLKQWLECLTAHRCQPKTMERCRQLAAYVTTSTAPEISKLANMPLSSVARKDLKLALFALLRVKAQRREHIFPRTVRHIAGLISSALSEAVELEMLPADPMLGIKGLPAAEKPEVRALTPAEIRLLRDVCRGDWTFPLVEVAMAAGCRRGELLALQWTDIAWESRTLNVSRSLEQTAAGLRIKTTKSKKTRHFELSKSAITALQFLRGSTERTPAPFRWRLREPPADLLPTEWGLSLAGSDFPGNSTAVAKGRHQGRQPPLIEARKRHESALEGRTCCRGFRQVGPCGPEHHKPDLQSRPAGGR